VSAEGSVAPPGRAMKWWGWGDPDQQPRLPEHAATMLRDELGLEEIERPPVEIDEVRLASPRMAPVLRARLAAIVGSGAVRDDREARVSHAAGKSYPDLVRQRAGDCSSAPDLVVSPRSHDQVRAVLEACDQLAVAVVPFGGGTSVVGGVEPFRGPFETLICLDLGAMDRLVSVDERSLTAVLEPGMRGPEVEAALRARGLTLGHFPQSFEYATLGGFVATRSAGQASTGYGRIDELVLGVRMAAPTGDLVGRTKPASAAGPDLRELIVGSEGTLGVITQAALRVRRAPEKSRFEGWFFRTFAEGAEALRALEQNGDAPDVARLSDESETRLNLTLAGTDTLKARAGARYLRLRGYDEGCLAIFGWDGTATSIDRRRRRAGERLRAAGGLPVGQGPGQAWARNRYFTPYLRDDMLGRGVMVETLETATQWSDLMGLHEAVASAIRSALAERGTPALVMCHVSHLYPSGASLYFTFLARQQQGEEIEQWKAAKQAAGAAIVAHGATITHHHAIGRDHLPWMEAEIGQRGVAALRAVKRELDPAGIMNPGKLLPLG
jgi:alkyldihydroxyacetonephosphate synthase